MKSEMNRAASLGGLLEQMSTEELRELLNRELHTEPVNEDAIRLIRSVLRQRSENMAVTISPELERAWEKYQRDTEAIWQESRRKQRLRSWMIRGAAAAAVLAVLVVPIVPQQAGAESLWQTLTRWTAQVVEFFGPSDNEDRIVEYVFQTDHPGLQQVYDTVVEMGITEPVVPMWLPEGYELVQLRVDQYPSKTKIYCGFEYTGKQFVLKIERYDTMVSHKFQTDETYIGEFEYSGVIYQMYRNLDKIVAVWAQNDVECAVSADCQEEVLQRILKSISEYGG